MVASTLVFPALVLALSAVVMAAAWASSGPVRAFRVGFLWAFALVLITPWVGGYSPESATINGAASGLAAAALWWVFERLTPSHVAARRPGMRIGSSQPASFL